MNKKLWIILVIVIVVLGYWLWGAKWQQPTAPEGALPVVPEVSEEDTTTAIQQDLEQIDLGDIDELFKGIDTELQGL